MTDSSSLSRNTRKATQIKEESRAHLRLLNVAEGQPMMAPKPAPAQLPASRDMIRTNMFAVKFKKPTRVFRYDLTITGRVEGQDRFDFTRRAGSDVQIVDRKEKCRAAIELLIRDHANIVPPRNECVYDLQSILFTFKEITIKDASLELVVPLTDNDMQLPDMRGRPMFINSTELSFLIKPVRNFNLVLSDDAVRDSVNQNLEEQDSNLQQFVEILTSQNVFADAQHHVTFQGGRSYLMNPQDHGFDQRDAPDLGRGAYLAIGAQKSCKVVEGVDRNNPRLTVVVENKKTPFHAYTPVEQKIKAAGLDPIRDINAVNRLLKDIWVMPMHAPSQADFKIHSVDGNARIKSFNFNGQDVTIEQYFQQHFEIQLQHPEWPLLVARGRDGQSNYYPIEMCHLCDNQRLTSAHLTPDQTATIIRTCAKPPRDQMQQISNNFAALRVNAGPSIAAAGVDVGDSPVEFSGSSVPHPTIQFDRRNIEFDAFRGEWKPPPNARFLLPARVQTWAVYIQVDRRHLNEQMLQRFLASFMARCQQSGMVMSDPIEQIYLDNLDHLRARFDAARSARENDNVKVDLIMAITNRQDLEVHQVLKSLEQEYDIVTQNVTTKVVLDALKEGGGRLTLSNVVNKTNLKCGGLNYAVYPAGFKEPLGADDLFIGFGSNHPGGYSGDEERRTGGAPTVIGYAANDLAHPCAFSGDYIFAESRRDEKVGVIDQIVKLCVERYQKNRGKNPKRIFVFRNGCSEGQFPSVLRFEVPLIEAALKQLNVSAGVTLIVPNRMHNVRLFPTNPKGMKAWEQNLPCGTAVDSVINHPVFFDFYLLSHIARQGTAKVPRYTVLFDSNKLSSEEAIVISYCLCFEHQIINGPTSFPTPVYIANRFAERGRMVYNVFQRTQLALQPEMPGFDEYNERLTYWNREAREVRFNA